MDIGIVLALFFGGATLMYGGHSLNANYRLWMVISYGCGVVCLVAEIILVVLRTIPPEVGPPIVSNTLIAAGDQVDLGKDLKNRTASVGLHCTAQIIRGPTLSCEDDSHALSNVLARGGWQQPNPITSHGWIRLKSRIVIRATLLDGCRTELSLSLMTFGIWPKDIDDPNMRELNRVDIILQPGR